MAAPYAFVHRLARLPKNVRKSIFCSAKYLSLLERWQQYMIVHHLTSFHPFFYEKWTKFAKVLSL